MKPMLAVDFDDVLIDCVGSAITFHNAKYGTKHEMNQMKVFAMEELWQCSRDEAINRLGEFQLSEYHRNAKSIVGASVGIQILAFQYDMTIITARSEAFERVTLNWLQENFPDVFRRIIFVNHCDDEIRRNKSKVCKEIGAVLCIDDGLHNAEDVAGVDIPVLLLDKPWNQKPIKNPLITRVFSWDEILEKA